MDAALLGLTLPILKPFGMVNDYFYDIGVNTMAISGHKLPGITTVCGVVLSTKYFVETAFSSVDSSIACIGGSRDLTFSGSRSGLNVLLLHNILHTL